MHCLLLKRASSYILVAEKLEVLMRPFESPALARYYIYRFPGMRSYWPNGRTSQLLCGDGILRDR